MAETHLPDVPKKELADLQAEMAALSDGISKKRTANNEKKKAVAKQNAAVKAQKCSTAARTMWKTSMTWA